MSDTTADTATTDTQPPATSDTGDQGSTDTVEFWKAEAEKHKGLSRKHEDRAKANADAVKELEKLKQSSMSDTEKAIDQARAEARQSVLGEVGGKVAAAEIRAAAAGRMAPGQLEVLLDGLNLARFIREDGEVDRDKVASFIDGIAPKQDQQQASTQFDLGQGSRGGNDLALNGDPLLRDLKSKLGIR